MVAPMRLVGRGAGRARRRLAERRRFDEQDSELLEAFAGLASLALRNAEAFEERSRQARDPARLLPHRLRARRAALAGGDPRRGGAGGRRGARRRRRRGRADAEPATRSGSPGRTRCPRRCVAALEAARRRLRRPRTRSSGAPHPRRAAARDDDRFGDGWRAARGGVRGFVSLLAIPVELREARTRRARARLLRRASARSRDDDLELARQLAGAARGALERSELFEAERTLACARAAARAHGQPARDRARPGRGARRGRPAGAGAARRRGLCRSGSLEGDELVVSGRRGRGRGRRCSASRSQTAGWLSGEVVAVALRRRGRGCARRRSAAPRRRRCSRPGLPRLPRRAARRAGGSAPRRARRLRRATAALARRRRSRRCRRLPATRRPRSRTPSCTSASRSRRSAARDPREHRRRDRGRRPRRRRRALEPSRRAGHGRAGRGGARPRAAAGTAARPRRRGRGPGDRLVRSLRGGDEVWLSVTEAVMRDPAGAVAGRIFAFRDISADRLVEEMKSEFVATVSHELRAAADLDLRLRRDAAARRRPLRRGGAPRLPRATSPRSRSG